MGSRGHVRASLLHALGIDIFLQSHGTTVAKARPDAREALWDARNTSFAGSRQPNLASKGFEQGLTARALTLYTSMISN